jgi:hypothetical protein
VVAISLSNMPAETIVPMVNVVASAYSQACRDQWKLRLEQTYSAAEEKVRQAERQASEAQTRFELLRDRRLQALASARLVVPPQPATMDNPRWVDACRRLADLEERRRVLLFERTLLHPSVQEIEARIHDANREIASIPPKITQEPAATVLPAALTPADAPAAAEVQAAQQAAEQSKEDSRHAQAIERAAQTARGEELSVDLLPAEPLPQPPATPRAATLILGKALVTATTSIIGLGMICFGASLEPALSSIAELQSLVPVPVVGLVPAAHPSRCRTGSPLRQRLARWGWMSAGLALLFVVVWLLFRG